MTSVRLGKIFGIRVNLHYTWFFILILLAWSLAADYFPAEYPGLTETTYWIYGLAAGILLFACVLAHELSHSLVAMHEGLDVKGITLFFFGGIANASEEGLTPGKEFRIAIAGPLLSTALGGLFFLIMMIPFTKPVFPILDYLFKVNLILAAFNMIPGFPLDGGRVFRSIVWKFTENLKKATKWASNIGKLFGIGLVITGFITLFSGAGLWYVLLGGFLYMLAGASYKQVELKESLEKHKVKDLMNTDFTMIKSDMNVENLVEEHLKRGEARFLVKDRGRYYLIDFDSIKKIPRHNWPVAMINDYKVKAEPARENHDAYKALLSMQKQNLNMLPVVKKDKVTGVISIRELASL